MKKLLVLLAVLFVAPLVSAISVEQCDNGWGCVMTDGFLDDVAFFSDARFGGPSTWELSLWDGFESKLSDTDYAHGDSFVDFSVAYDAESGKAVFTYGGIEQSSDFGSGLGFSYITIFLRSRTGTNVELRKLQLNGNDLSDMDAGQGYEATRTFMDDSEQSEGFVLTGEARLVGEKFTATNLPSFQVFAMNPHRLRLVNDGGSSHRQSFQQELTEIPEFGTVAAGVALVGAIAGFLFLRKKN